MADYRSDPLRGRWDSQTWSLTLGSLFGIRIRVHWLLILIAAMLVARGMYDLGWLLALKYIVPLLFMLWGCILLHEFGHCFGCRSVGGTADDILMWPLGGLAACEPPPHPIPNLITTLCGPMVNLAFVVVLAPVVLLSGGAAGPLFNPMGNPFDVVPFAEGGWAIYAVLLFKVNYILLLFNMMLPIYPFDLGRTLQELLWMRVGYYPSMVVSTNVGIVASIILVGLGLYFAGAHSSDYFWLSAVGIFGFVQSVKIRRDLEINASMIDNEFGYDFSQGYTSLDRQHDEGEAPPRRLRISPLAILRHWRQRRQEAFVARAESELDRILDKIHAQGMSSLSRAERRMLETASLRRRRK